MIGSKSIIEDKMPLKRLKYTFDYCSANPIGFLIILFLIWSINFMNSYADAHTIKYKLIFYPMAFLVTLFMYGYGLAITKDTIRNGEKLPIIKLKQCTVFGIKASIMIFIYTLLEGFLLYDLSNRFYLPEFHLRFALSHLIETLKLYYWHNPVSTIEFIIVSIMITYIVAFFLEISLARLADGGRLLGAFNILKIKRCIDTIGWKHYTADYTKIMLSIVILAYLQFGIDLFGFFSEILDLIIGLLIFIIEFIGIGKIYQEYKIKKVKRGIEID